MKGIENLDFNIIREEIAGVLGQTCLEPMMDEISGYVANGKMLRGKLPLYISCGAGYTIDHGCAAKVGAAIEMIHAASLLHDDVIDNSEVRRGKSSFWAAKGIQGAILFGDMLICKAFKLLNDSIPSRISELIELTSSVCEAEIEQELVTKGQALTYDRSINIARKKTGALFAFTSSCCGGSDTELSDALRETGYRLGTAYQLADDVLDEYGCEGDSGKPLGNDRKSGKATLANTPNQVDLVDEIESLYNSYEELLAKWPDVRKAWESYLAAEFKPVIDKFLKNYINR